MRRLGLPNTAGPLPCPPPPPLSKQGLSQLFDAGAWNLDQAMVSFERLAAVTALAVPPELFMDQVRAPRGAGRGPGGKGGRDAHMPHT